MDTRIWVVFAGVISLRTCAFFGHRSVPPTVETPLRQTIYHLIEQEGVDCFLVGNHGEFDAMVRRLLKSAQKDFPHICYAVVLAYLPTAENELQQGETDTIFPEGLETVPQRYAICKRNRWMLKKADFVVAYAPFSFGGAATYKKLAEKQGKIVFELAE